MVTPRRAVAPCTRSSAAAVHRHGLEAGVAQVGVGEVAVLEGDQPQAGALPVAAAQVAAGEQDALQPGAAEGGQVGATGVQLDLGQVGVGEQGAGHARPGDAHAAAAGAAQVGVGEVAVAQLAVAQVGGRHPGGAQVHALEHGGVDAHDRRHQPAGADVAEPGLHEPVGVECGRRLESRGEVRRLWAHRARVGFRLMSDRAAIVTGASRGIGLAIADVLGQEGYGLTITARKPEGLEDAAAELRGKGYEVQAVPANMNDEEAIIAVVSAHREKFGRCDALVNNAGVGIGAAMDEHVTKRIDMQLDVNIRAVILFYRECAEMLKAAGAEHRQALVINLASIAGKSGQAWLSVYSATKFAVVGYTQAMNKELGKEGVKSTAFCPGFVDTAMTEFAKQHVKAEEMIRPEDIGEAARFLLRLSPACVVPEIVFQRPDEIL